MVNELYYPEFNSDDIKISNAIDQGVITIGITESHIADVIERQPNMFDLYKKVTERDEVFTTWVVNGSCKSMNLLRTYTFKFKNDNLFNWSYK